MFTVRKMVDKNTRARRGLLAVLTLDTVRKAQEIIKADQDVEDTEQKKKTTQETSLTPKQRMQRQVRMIRFAHRLGLAAKQKESVDDIVLEVSEAVAAHWLEVRWYYVGVAYNIMAMAFVFLGTILAAQ